MEYIYLLIAAILVILVGAFIYFRKNEEASVQIEETPNESVPEELEIEEPEPEMEDDDSYLNPVVSEVEDAELVKSGYKRIEIPANMIPMIAETLKDGAVIFHQSRTFRVQFSPEVVKGLKDKSMTLIERVNGKGYMPAVKKDGVKGIYEQAVQ